MVSTLLSCYQNTAEVTRNQALSHCESMAVWKRKRKDYAFWRQYNEKASFRPGCSGTTVWHRVKISSATAHACSSSAQRADKIMDRCIDRGIALDIPSTLVHSAAQQHCNQTHHPQMRCMPWPCSRSALV